LVLKFVPSAGRVYGAATHVVGGDAGYGLLFLGCRVDIHAYMPTWIQAALGHRTRG
jgi:hypothetical protein